MKRLTLLFIPVFALNYLNAHDATIPVQVFLRPPTYAISTPTEGLRILELVNDTLADFDINTFLNVPDAIRNHWNQAWAVRAAALMNIFRENFDNYAVHHRGGYTGNVKIYERTQKRPNPTTTYATTFEVWELDTLVAAHRLLADRPAVLNMADDITPGGFLNSGGSAQEESISYRAHDMVIALMRAKQAVYGNAWQNVYQKTEHGPKFIQEQGAIYAPQVKVLRAPADGLHYEPLEQDNQFSFDIIASVAYDLRWGNDIPANYEAITKDKMRTQLRVALDNGNTTILLSAYGCGCHHNDPKVIAAYYKEILNEDEFRCAFKKVVFSILDFNIRDGKPNLTAFKNCFEGYAQDKGISTGVLVAGSTVGAGAAFLIGDRIVRKERSFVSRAWKCCTGKNKRSKLSATAKEAVAAEEAVEIETSSLS